MGKFASPKAGAALPFCRAGFAAQATASTGVNATPKLKLGQIAAMGAAFQ